jgi:hypothetical protein
MGLADVTTLIGFAGGLAVLASFAGVACGRLWARSATYHAMNLFGGLALVAAGLAAEAWPSVAVNGSWALISVHGLARRGSVRHQANDPLARRREDVQGLAALRAREAAVLDVRRDHDAVAAVHDARLAADGERQLAGQHDRDLLLEVMVCRCDGVRLEPDEVRHHRLAVHRAELDPRDHDQRIEILDADEPRRRVRRLA